MSERIFVEGVDYTPLAIEDARESLVELRKGAMTQNEFGWVVLLSHVIAYLADYKKLRLEEMVSPNGDGDRAPESPGNVDNSRGGDTNRTSVPNPD